jgi:hypothetical protein
MFYVNFKVTTKQKSLLKAQNKYRKDSNLPLQKNIKPQKKTARKNGKNKVST